jgi:hypothetical protein
VLIIVGSSNFFGQDRAQTVQWGRTGVTGSFAVVK